MKSHEQDVQEWINLILPSLNQSQKQDLKRVSKLIPYSFFFDSSKFIQQRIRYKLDLAISLLDSEPFRKVKDNWEYEILVALLLHDCWEAEGCIVGKYDPLHAYSAAKEIRTLANQSKSDFLYSIADIIESHEGSKLSDLEHPHLLAIPQTIPQKFVYQIVQVIDRQLIPNIAYDLYHSSISSESNFYDTFRASLEKLI